MFCQAIGTIIWNSLAIVSNDPYVTSESIVPIEPCSALGGGGILPSKRLLGMCRWMGSHFHNWTDYNGVTFLVEWGRKFSGFL